MTNPGMTVERAADLFNEFQQIAASRPYLEADLAKINKEIEDLSASINQSLASLGYDQSQGTPEEFLEKKAVQIETWIKELEPVVAQFKGLVK